MGDTTRSQAALMAAAACLAASALLTPALTRPALMIAVVMVVAGTARFLRLLHAHQHVVRDLNADAVPRLMDGETVWMTSAVSGALVAGLLAPRIYLNPRIGEHLDEQSLRAVLQHEREHQRRRDPARMLLLATMEPALRRLPGGTNLAGELRARFEIRADKAAMLAGSSRSALARALLTLAKPYPAGTASFSGASDARLRALLDGPSRRPTRPLRSLLGAAVGWLAACSLMWAAQAWTTTMALCPLGC